MAITDKSCADTLTQNFIINGAVPQASFALRPGQLLCSGDSIYLTNNSSVNFGTLTRQVWYWGGADSTVNLQPCIGNIFTHHYPEFGTPASMPRAHDWWYKAVPIV